MREREHHVEQILAVPQFGIRVIERKTLRPTVRKGGNRPHLADQTRGSFDKRLGVLKRQELLVIIRQVAQTGGQDRHGGRIHRNLLKLMPGTFVQQLVPRQQFAELPQFVARRHAAENEHPGHPHEARIIDELLDRNPPVAQDPLLAVNKRDGTLAGPGVAQRRIVGDIARLVAQLGDVDGLLTLRPHNDGKFELLAFENQDCFLRVLCHVEPFLMSWIGGSESANMVSNCHTTASRIRSDPGRFSERCGISRKGGRRWRI